MGKKITIACRSTLLVLLTIFSTSLWAQPKVEAFFMNRHRRGIPEAGDEGRRADQEGDPGSSDECGGRSLDLRFHGSGSPSGWLVRQRSHAEIDGSDATQISGDVDATSTIGRPLGRTWPPGRLCLRMEVS